MTTTTQNSRNPAPRTRNSLSESCYIIPSGSETLQNTHSRSTEHLRKHPPPLHHKLTFEGLPGVNPALTVTEAPDLGGFRHLLRSTRFTICLLLIAAIFSMTFMNVSMGMSIICMTKANQGAIFKHPPHNETYSRFKHESKCEFGTNDGSIRWSAAAQGLVLSSLSWGRLLTPAAGVLSDRFNSKVLISLGVGLAAVATALIPTAAKLSFYLVITLRVITGLADALVQPSVNNFVVRWFPKSERSVIITMVTCGNQIAVLVAFPLAGYFCTRNDLLGGWPMTFYVIAGFVMIWQVLWLLLSSQNPAKHRRITKKEVEYLSGGQATKKMKRVVPWTKILLCLPMWVNIAAILCHEIPSAVVFVFLPGYLRDVLHFSFKANGLLSALPAAAFLLSKLLAGQLSFFILRSGRLQQNTLAKVFNFIASAGLGGFLIAASFFRCNARELALGLITGAIAFGGLHSVGCISTLILIAPKFAGTVGGLAFFAMGGAMLLCPVVVKSIVTTGAAEEWRVVLIGIGVVALLPTVFFTIIGSAQAVSWGDHGSEDRKNSESSDSVSTNSSDFVGTVEDKTVKSALKI